MNLDSGDSDDDVLKPQRTWRVRSEPDTGSVSSGGPSKPSSANQRVISSLTSVVSPAAVVVAKRRRSSVPIAEAPKASVVTIEPMVRIRRLANSGVESRRDVRYIVSYFPMAYTARL
jgi:hypothetical protein